MFAGDPQEENALPVKWAGQRKEGYLCYALIRMIDLLAKGLVVTGTLLLGAALWRGRQLMAQLPQGHLRQNWFGLNLLVVGFVLGYIGYVIGFSQKSQKENVLLVPLLFLFSAIFMWLTMTLANETTTGLKRMGMLEVQSITDSLTGFYNRRFLEKELPRQVERSRRDGVPLSVLMVDVDHFKAINDTYGHDAGDQVLRRISQLITEGLPEAGIAVRYGGDEIFVMAPETEEGAAEALAQRLRERVETEGYVYVRSPGRTQKIPLTISIGVASMGPRETDAILVLRKADEALHRAKQLGRNRVVVHDPRGSDPAP